MSHQPCKKKQLLRTSLPAVITLDEQEVKEEGEEEVMEGERDREVKSEWQEEGEKEEEVPLARLPTYYLSFLACLSFYFFGLLFFS